MAMSPGERAAAQAAFAWACALDVDVPKPGNVSGASPAHDMDAAMFVASANAAAGPLFDPGASVGARIEGAIEATSAAVDRNTNLGIVLLCAPIAAALDALPAHRSVDDLRRATQAVLDTLTIDDAQAAYRAIARARPGGMGRVSDQDVGAVPTVDLRSAMALATDRDRVARQYGCGYADVFDVALPTFLQILRVAGDADVVSAVQGTFIALLAQWPDSHIVRRHGEAVAQSVTQEAKRWRSLALQGRLRDYARQLAAWDASLKRQRINPGTTADMVVTTAFAAACTDPSLTARSNIGPVHGTV